MPKKPGPRWRRPKGPPEANIALSGFMLYAKSTTKRPSLELVYVEETGELKKSSYWPEKAILYFFLTLAVSSTNLGSILLFASFIIHRTFTEIS